MSEDAVATTWAELREDESTQADGIGEAYDYYEAAFSKRPPDHPLAAVPFQSAIDVVASAALMQGAKAAKPLAAKLKDRAEAIAAADEPVAQATLAALGLANLCACAGWPEPAIADREALLASLRSADLLPENRRQAAWAHLAWGVTDGIGALLPGNIKGKPDPSAQYGPNVQGTQIHVAKAIIQGTGPDSVEAAWNGFVDHFPRLLAAEQSTYVELLFAARAVFARIGGVPDGKVLDRLRKQIA